jgi:NAD+ diphosphatase
MTAPESPRPPVSRLGAFDRSAPERTEPGLVDILRDDARTRVVVVRSDATPVGEDGGLALASPSDVPIDAEWAFLGRSADGTAVLVASLDSDADSPESVRWAGLRAIGGSLHAADTDALVTAVALGRWLRDAAYCPACGTRTTLQNAGWSRTCPSCGREHFPRTDPAVIVAVTRADDPDALLLGSNALWGADRYSCFAGFAEAGESLEDTVVREVREEAGVTVAALRYVASQGWPYPRSLMLGFRAEALVASDAEPDGEEIVDVRWFTRAEIGEGLAGTSALQLPGPASIAHRLISGWYAEAP